MPPWGGVASCAVASAAAEANALLTRALLQPDSISRAAAGISAVTTSRHERDFYGWVQQQCAALRDHNSSRLDWSGLLENWKPWDAKNSGS